MTVLDTIGRSLLDGAGMFWETLWALVLGFTLSGAVQAFVSRAALGRMVTEAEVGSAVLAMLAMPGMCGADVDLSAGMIA